MSENKQVLKMCPFCGADAKLEQPRNRAGVSCTECGCRTPLMHSVADALSIWNERSAVLSASAGEKKDAERITFIEKHGKRGSTYRTMTSIDIIVRADILERDGAIAAIDDRIRATNSMQSTKEEK